MLKKNPIKKAQKKQLKKESRNESKPLLYFKEGFLLKEKKE